MDSVDNEKKTRQANTQYSGMQGKGLTVTAAGQEQGLAARELRGDYKHTRDKFN